MIEPDMRNNGPYEEEYKIFSGAFRVLMESGRYEWTAWFQRKQWG